MGSRVRGIMDSAPEPLEEWWLGQNLGFHPEQQLSESRPQNCENMNMFLVIHCSSLGKLISHQEMQTWVLLVSSGNCQIPNKPDGHQWGNGPWY